jgi:hypothetical protein
LRGGKAGLRGAGGVLVCLYRIGRKFDIGSGLRGIMQITRANRVGAVDEATKGTR